MVSKVFTVFSFIISLLAFASSTLKITFWIQYNNYCPKETLFSYVRKLKQVISFLLLPFINFSPYVKSKNLEQRFSRIALFEAQFCYFHFQAWCWPDLLARFCRRILCPVVCHPPTLAPHQYKQLRESRATETEITRGRAACLRALVLENKNCGCGRPLQTDDQKMVGSKEILFLSMTRQGIIS